MQTETPFLKFWRALNDALRYLGRPPVAIGLAHRAYAIEPNPARATILFYSPRMIQAVNVERRQ